MHPNEQPEEEDDSKPKEKKGNGTKLTLPNTTITGPPGKKKDGKEEEALFYLANGFLSMISDNVFVATVYISEVEELFLNGEIDRATFDAMAVAINTGTNIPSVATPNGQAAFLFLLTSALAPLIRLSYGRMVVMALPYTITMSITGLLALWFLGDWSPAPHGS